MSGRAACSTTIFWLRDGARRSSLVHLHAGVRRGSSDGASTRSPLISTTRRRGSCRRPAARHVAEARDLRCRASVGRLQRIVSLCAGARPACRSSSKLDGGGRRARSLVSVHSVDFLREVLLDRQRTGWAPPGRDRRSRHPPSPAFSSSSSGMVPSRLASSAGAPCRCRRGRACTGRTTPRLEELASDSARHRRGLVLPDSTITAAESDEAAVRLQRVEVERDVAQALAGRIPPEAPPGR